MKITAVFDNMEAADAAARQIDSVMPSAHRRTTPLRGSSGEAPAPSGEGVYAPGAMVPQEVFYARSSGFGNAGLASSPFPDSFSGIQYSPEMYQGLVPYPVMDGDGVPISHEDSSSEVLLSIEVGAINVDQAKSILVNHHGRNIRVCESHK